MPRCQKLFLLKWNLCLVVLLLFFTTHYYSQPYTHTYAPLGDAYITKDIPDENYGTDDQLYVVNVDGMTSLEYCSLLKFDVSNIPSNAIITEVELKLKSTLGNQSELIFQYLTENWSEPTVTWDTRPTESNQFYFEEIPTTSFLAGPNITYHHFDDIELKNMIQYWVYDASLNFGVILKKEVSTTINTNTYSSKEAGITYWGNLSNGQLIAVDHRPRLTVKYVLPITINLESIIHATATSSGDGSITATASGGNGTYTYQWYNSSGNAIGTNSPTISGLDYGWYGVKVTDGLGVESYMSFIVGVECEKVSITYNPGPDYVDDAYISNLRTVTSDLSDYNYGGALTLLVRRMYNSTGIIGYFNMKSLIRFLLINDPYLEFNKADLKVRVTNNTGTGNSPLLRLITEQWKEYSVTYNNQPTISSIIEKATGINSSGTKTIDTKEFWTHWKESPNYGFLLDLENPNLNAQRMVITYSSDYTSVVSYRPQIEFEVSLECPKPVTLKERLNGELYLMYRPVLFFHFDELQDAETGEQLKFEIRDNTNTVIASSDHFGAPVGVNTVLPHRTHGNYHTLFLSGLNIPADVVHTLIVYSINGKKRYLNFKKVN